MVESSIAKRVFFTLMTIATVNGDASLINTTKCKAGKYGLEWMENRRI